MGWSPAGCVCASAQLPSGWVRTGADAGPTAGATAGLAPREGELGPGPCARCSLALHTPWVSLRTRSVIFPTSGIISNQNVSVCTGPDGGKGVGHKGTQQCWKLDVTTNHVPRPPGHVRHSLPQPLLKGRVSRQDVC